MAINSYSPPEGKICNDYYVEAYNRGLDDAKNGLEDRGDELYPPSNHERDTTFSDELGYEYYRGYYDWEKNDG